MPGRWIADSKVSGLGMMVLPSGVRTYYLRYREPNGHQQFHKIGRAGLVSVTAAREEAHKVLADVARGLAPTTARKQRRHAPTIEQLLKQIKLEHWPRLRLRSQKNNELIWRLHLLPVFGQMKVCEIERRHVLAWFTAHSKDRPIRANRCLEVLTKAMNLAELWELRPQGLNPCKGITANRERKKQHYLSRTEIKQLLEACETFGTTELRWRFTRLIQLLLFTGARLNEIMTARWEWVNWERSQLVLPPENHKTGGDGESRIIYLSPPAVEVLAELQKRAISAYIIHGAGDRPLVGARKLWLQLLKQAGIKHMRIHDLRHSFASLARSANLSLPLIGGLLGHTSPQSTARYLHLYDDTAAASVAKVAKVINLC